MRNAVTVFCLVICGLLLSATSIVAQRTAEARKMTCEDKDLRIDDLMMQLRLRAAELAVAHSQLRAANKKLERCGGGGQEE